MLPRRSASHACRSRCHSECDPIHFAQLRRPRLRANGDDSGSFNFATLKLWNQALLTRHAALGSRSLSVLRPHGRCNSLREAVAPRLVAFEGNKLASVYARNVSTLNHHVNRSHSGLSSMRVAVLESCSAHCRHSRLHPSLNNSFIRLHFNATHHSCRLGLHAFLVLGPSRALVASCSVAAVSVPSHRRRCLGVPAPLPCIFPFACSHLRMCYPPSASTTS
jgi:hypothetical protein